MGLFGDDTVVPLDFSGMVQSLTPELLLDFIYQYRRATGRQFPTLDECCDEFGVLLGVLVVAWELDRRGVLKRLRRQPIRDDPKQSEPATRSKRRR